MPLLSAILDNIRQLFNWLWSLIWRVNQQGQVTASKKDDLAVPKPGPKSDVLQTEGDLKDDEDSKVVEKWREMKENFLKRALEEKRSTYRCGKDYVSLDDVKTWADFFEENELWLTRHVGKDINVDVSDVREISPELNAKVSTWRGDITTLEIDAIVNAANKTLLGGGGVDGAIHRAAGEHLVEECATLNGCETGNAKITGGYKLPAKYVIHTVGPIGAGDYQLTNCYKTSLRLMKENHLRSIAFPCISTGIYGFPNERAARLALSTTRDFLENNSEVDRVIFCLFMPEDVEIYETLMQVYFPVRENRFVSQTLAPKEVVKNVSNTQEDEPVEAEDTERDKEIEDAMSKLPHIPSDDPIMSEKIAAEPVKDQPPSDELFASGVLVDSISTAAESASPVVDSKENVVTDKEQGPLVSEPIINQEAIPSVSASEGLEAEQITMKDKSLEISEETVHDKDTSDVVSASQNVESKDTVVKETSAVSLDVESEESAENVLESQDENALKKDSSDVVTTSLEVNSTETANEREPVVEPILEEISSDVLSVSPNVKSKEIAVQETSTSLVEVPVQDDVTEPLSESTVTNAEEIKQDPTEISATSSETQIEQQEITVLPSVEGDKSEESKSTKHQVSSYSEGTSPPEVKKDDMNIEAPEATSFLDAKKEETILDSQQVHVESQKVDDTLEEAVTGSPSSDAVPEIKLAPEDTSVASEDDKAASIESVEPTPESRQVEVSAEEPLKDVSEISKEQETISDQSKETAALEPAEGIPDSAYTSSDTLGDADEKHKIAIDEIGNVSKPCDEPKSSEQATSSTPDVDTEQTMSDKLLEDEQSENVEGSVKAEHVTVSEAVSTESKDISSENLQQGQVESELPGDVEGTTTVVDVVQQAAGESINVSKEDEVENKEEKQEDREIDSVKEISDNGDVLTTDVVPDQEDERKAVDEVVIAPDVANEKQQKDLQVAGEHGTNGSVQKNDLEDREEEKVVSGPMTGNEENTDAANSLKTDMNKDASPVKEHSDRL